MMNVKDFLQLFLKLLKHDIFLSISIISLLILLPIGFTIDKQKLESECLSDPILSAGDEVFKKFIESSHSNIDIIIPRIAWNPSKLENYVSWLKEAKQRNVKVRILTSVEYFKNFSNAGEVVTIGSSPELGIFMGTADAQKVIYAPGALFVNGTSYLGELFLEFSKCKSVAKDVESIIDLLWRYAKKGSPSVFLRKWIPGITFPSRHEIPHGELEIAMAPAGLVPPGRTQVEDMADRMFDNEGGNISLVTVPELFLTEKLETISLTFANETNVQILVAPPSSGSNLTISEIRSLMEFPNIDVRVITDTLHIPTFYCRNDKCALVSVSFEEDTSVITAMININHPTASETLRQTFQDVWEQSSSFHW